MVNFRLIPLGIALAPASNARGITFWLRSFRVWMTATAKAGSRADSCYLAATPTYPKAVRATRIFPARANAS